MKRKILGAAMAAVIALGGVAVAAPANAATTSTGCQVVGGYANGKFTVYNISCNYPVSVRVYYRHPTTGVVTSRWVGPASIGHPATVAVPYYVSWTLS
ncbi:hypothetical protein CLV28_0898 [Sediminihabitans luteus]|uniref:Uncharacterized protein n=1 Tax=Sediminihabitans luteus TaxID=1138585 RepID=A0A2M9D0Q2_9CELL|nr:hypothetical protein [Sediminihabitans luteus]PJJ77673.1 hypothetical protein CLV28_0898 [Sediminihabitans luteus]GIJ00100.1 hypothetical protein Slu03_24770 [Sediminihabitans luteus]